MLFKKSSSPTLKLRNKVYQGKFENKKNEETGIDIIYLQ